MSATIHQTIIRFPEIQLATRDSHKLRGYFGNLFKEQSPLAAQSPGHRASSCIATQWCSIKYCRACLRLVGLNEGAELLIQLFLKIKSIDINAHSFPVLQKNIESRQITIGLSEDLHQYHFETLWMALNQQNYADYIKEPEQQQSQHLKSVLVGNILSFYKAMNYRAEGKIMANLQVAAQKETQFKNNAMLAFEAQFVTNALLPSFVGLGKSVARGFGTIRQHDI